MGVCLAFLGSRAVELLLLARSSPLSSLPSPSLVRRRRLWGSLSSTMGSAPRFAEDAVAALVSSTSLTTISPSSSLSSRSSYQRSASQSPSRGSFSSRTSSGSSSSSKGERISRLDFSVDGGMLNPRIHHRHGTNNTLDASEPSSHIPRDRSPSTSRSPSRRGRRAYPSSPSETQSRSPSASRHRPRNAELKLALESNVGGSEDAQSKLSTYDTIIALAFALCVILFLRALVGGGSVESEPAHPLSPPKAEETWWQKHHAFASSREHLHAKAGVHNREDCHDGQEKSEDGKVSGVWHRGGVHADPHGHVSVDPEGHFSYGFHHDHDHEHHDERNDYDQYRTANIAPSRSSPMTLTWGIPHFFRRSEPTKESDTIETPSSGAEGPVSDGLVKEETETKLLRAKETADDDPFANPDFDDVELHDYAVRVHLPSGEGFDLDKGRTLHRKERARTRGKGSLRS